MFAFLHHKSLAENSQRKDRANYLFVTLFLTQIIIFMGESAITRSKIAFDQSAPIALSCLLIAAVLYMLTCWFGSFAWSIVVTYSLIALLIYSPFKGREEFSLAIGFIGLIYTAKYLRISKPKIPATLLMAGIASVTVMAARVDTSFDMLFRLYAGDLAPDTIFHTSISAMIKNYNAISTGLNGVITVPYYALSHTLMGGLSLISHESILEVYGVASKILFAPILIFTIAIFCAELSKKEEPSISLYWSGIAVALWLIPRALGRWGVWESYFTSESYMIGLGLFMAALPCLFMRELSKTDAIFVLLATSLITYSKATVGIIYAGLWLTRVLFLRRKKWPSSLELACLGCAIIPAFAFALTPAQTQTAADGIKLAPLDFLLNYGGGNAVRQLAHMSTGTVAINARLILIAIWQILSFFIFHFLFSWIAIGAGVRELGIRKLFQTPITIYVLATTCVGILAVLLLGIPGGSLYYISNVAMFAALPCVIALAESKAQHQKISQNLILVLIFTIQIIGSINIFRNDIARTNRDREASITPAIETLLSLRSQPKNQIYRLTDERLPIIPGLPCDVYPLIFPAISEHAWINVIRPQKGCPLIYYGYSQYGLSLKHQEITDNPRILAGTEIIDVKFSP